jgi:molybdate-binding protein/DNA-binding transcriptional regulator YhcF (GntR family)
VEETVLYKRIADRLRKRIRDGELRPGDRLPSIRELTAEWHCTPGTIQKAYQELAQAGLIVSRPGQGTHVADAPLGAVRADAPLRWAGIVNRAEAFLLEVLTAGYTPGEAEQAMREALDRWRTIAVPPPSPVAQRLRFAGSHDPAVALIAARAAEVLPGWSLDLRFTGSLGGLMALARGEADLAGSHLWDEPTDSYNVPFVRRLLPGRRVALLTLARRHLGLITAPENPLGLRDVADLARPGLRFVNRQRGSGTRVWLDARLRERGVDPTGLAGYGDERATHGEVARAVGEGRADVGLGVESAARDYGLGFAPLTTERYDLIIPAEAWGNPFVQALARWLRTTVARDVISALGGYELADTGNVEWVE